jgi:hypothetical protein
MREYFEYEDGSYFAIWTVFTTDHRGMEKHGYETRDMTGKSFIVCPGPEEAEQAAEKTAAEKRQNAIPQGEGFWSRAIANIGGSALLFIDENRITPELCREALREDRNALAYIPDALKTAELCREAVRRSRLAISFVPESLLTAELCLESVQHNGLSLASVPERFKTANLCVEAVRQNGMAFRYIPEELQHIDLLHVRFAAEQNGLSLRFMPDSLLNSETEAYFDAMKQNAKAAIYVPQALFAHPRLPFFAVQENWRVLAYLPDSIKTPALCLEAVLRDREALWYVSEKHHNRVISFLLTHELKNCKTVRDLAGFLDREYFAEYNNILDSLHEWEDLVVAWSPSDSIEDLPPEEADKIESYAAFLLGAELSGKYGIALMDDSLESFKLVIFYENVLPPLNNTELQNGDVREICGNYELYKKLQRKLENSWEATGGDIDQVVHDSILKQIMEEQLIPFMEQYARREPWIR